MSRLIALLGILCGALAAFVGLLYNPMAEATLAADGGGARYNWTSLERHGGELGAAALTGLPLKQAGTPFSDESIATANASIVVLRDANGEAAALATRLVSAAGDGNPLQGDVGARVYMTVFLPNRGSLYLTGYENRWPIIRSELLGMVARSDESAWSVSTRGSAEQASRIVGGSGGFAGIGGGFREILSASPAADGTLTGEVELELSFR